jgi:prepilin-type processing-associated H-X9-DG protein
VVAASQKILVIDEDVTGINDGSWTAGGLELPDGRVSSVSVRHDKGREYGAPGTDPMYHRAGRGNVAFADGHCEFFGRELMGFPAYVDPRYKP